jgi:hypothetical protein
MLPFNPGAYSSYISTSANNIYIYNSISGAEMSAWIEGSASNELQPTGLNTVANLIIWMNLGTNTIAASSSANGIYYMGIGATTTSFLTSTSSNGIGEAPQLSCNNPANTMTGCGPNQYGEYDNGASVFSAYFNFANNVNNWNFKSASITGTANNGLTLTSSAGSQTMTYNSVTYTISSTPISYDILNELIGTSAAGNGADAFLGTSQTLMTDCYLVGIAGGGTTFIRAEIGVGTCPGATTFSSSATNTFYVYTINLAASGQLLQANYGQAASYSSSITPNSIPYYFGEQTGSGTQSFTQWLRVRNMPPSGVLPQITFGTITSATTSPTVTISTPSNSIQGQTESFSGTITGGTPNYNVFLYVVNSITPGTIVYSTNAIFSGSTWSFSTTIPANWVTNSPLEANVVLTDANSNIATSGYTSTFSITTAPALLINTYDISGNNNTGATSNVIWQTAKSLGKGQAVFNGYSSQITVPSSNSLQIKPQTSGFTASLWLYLSSTQQTESSSSATLLATNGNVLTPGSNQCGYAIWIDSVNTLRASDNCGHYYEGNYLFNAGAWYNLAVTVNPIGGNTIETYYVDGIAVSQGTSTTWTSGTSWNSLCIGSSCGANYFGGSITDVQTYKTALTAKQIWQLYASSPSATSSFTVPLSLFPSHPP